MKKINADITSYGAMICEEEYCLWRKECANHYSAGDFRSEDGVRPLVYLDQGAVVCETIHSEGHDEYSPYNDSPKHNDGRGQVLVRELVEKTNDFQI